MKIAVAIATAGRRAGLSQIVSYLARQTRLADSLYICPASDDDLDPACLSAYPQKSFVIRAPKGLPSQRNAILRAMLNEDVVVFFDDDYLPEPSYLQELEDLLERREDIVMVTGHVIADGAKGPGIEFEVAEKIIDNLPPLSEEVLWNTYGGYGCNMAIRMNVVRTTHMEFDENLPLYAWWEDIDFSRRMAPFGKIVQSFRLRGVHLGSKKGRTPGKRLGYSQVANILYMERKGSISRAVAYPQILKNVAANFLMQFWPEPWVDRRGRFFGNLIAFRDALHGKIHPMKILKL